MKFFLGTHKTQWLWFPEFAEIPLFISHRQLVKRKTVKPGAAPFALDSGGFTQLSTDPNGWPKGCEEPYVEAVYRYRDAVGDSLLWASQQDWMVEPWLLHGRTVREHQERTVENLLRLRELAPDLPFIPVLQGWELDDYHRSIDLFEEAGVDLHAEPIVGVGSVCRRQNTAEITSIVESIVKRGLRIHGFGVKTLGLRRYGDRLTSADSLAWSFRARRSTPLPGCTHGTSGTSPCNNCPKFALQWRARLLARIEGLEQKETPE